MKMCKSLFHPNEEEQITTAATRATVCSEGPGVYEQPHQRTKSQTWLHPALKVGLELKSELEQQQQPTPVHFP